MKTDDLINTLAVDAKVTERFESLVYLLLPAVLGMAILVALTLGFRPDLAAAVKNPLSLMRFVLGTGMGLGALWIVLTLARPQQRIGFRWLPLGSMLVIALVLWIATFVSTPSDGLRMAILGKTATVCLIAIPLLSIVPTFALFALLRRAAPIQPKLAGAAAGLCGGGLAAATYALHCTEDSPLFYVTWYGLGIMIVMAASSYTGHRLLRW